METIIATHLLLVPKDMFQANLRAEVDAYAYKQHESIMKPVKAQILSLQATNWSLIVCKHLKAGPNHQLATVMQASTILAVQT